MLSKNTTLNGNMFVKWYIVEEERRRKRKEWSRKSKLRRKKRGKEERKGRGGREKGYRVLKSTKVTLLSHIRKLWHEVKQILCEYFLGNVSLSEVFNLVRLSRHRVALQVPPEDREFI